MKGKKWKYIETETKLLSFQYEITFNLWRWQASNDVGEGGWGEDERKWLKLKQKANWKTI